ncbi:Pre-mRNA-splicing factor SPF27 [Kockovaella imperatae]|uniref:Pre-mRNA-splicing factor SPF27 n=1 Tax=Kockovaella imperatae TaxID=4999 RepID=A0A1Y1UM32_9TREE|nr:Pre-mRNA-splicing factor SPF27 [Kockovaella imperatae]ORX39059.1 Pre-mRNA-splicing factor SPF27 [Kockovaella imperatae]
MASSNIDALPYFDKQLEAPGAKSSAQALIEAELRNTPQISLDDPRLPAEVKIFAKSESLSELLDGYATNPIRGIDTSKYGVPQVTEGSSIDELVEAERRGRIGEGHMAVRIENADLLSTYGPNAWLIRNYQLNSQLTELQSTLEALKEKVTEVNRSRRVFQEDTGTHLTRLEGRWQDLVGSTVQLEVACKAMEGQVKTLRRKEEDLKKEVQQLEDIEKL